MSGRKDLEVGFERLLFASRWLLAPVYLGLVFALFLLVIVFARELWHYLPQIMKMDADKVVVMLLTLIDMALAGNLLLIVIFSGYENFVSKFDVEKGDDRPEWMGKIDFSSLKIKLIASIVAISAIQLLKRFMEIGKGEVDAAQAAHELRWLVILHLTFVISGVLMALMDWLKARSKGCE